jgi:hypothetical protein
MDDIPFDDQPVVWKRCEALNYEDRNGTNEKVAASHEAFHRDMGRSCS